MSYLTPPNESDPEVAKLYAADRDRLGYVPNYTKVFAHRPEAYEAWKGLGSAVRTPMSLRIFELATVTAARRLRSSYCALAHGKILAQEIGAPTVEHVMAGDLSGLDEVDAAVVRFADRVASAPADVAPGDWDELRRLGYDDATILDVVLATAARCFFSTVLEATGAEPDEVYHAMTEDLRTALTVGRPIAAAS